MDPIGKSEDLRTEFKRADSLRDASNVAREVVAFLNSHGGDVWIGVGEEGGKAVSIDAIPEAEHQRRRLEDALIDLIEPSPAMGIDVEIEEVPFADDETKKVLRVRVKPGKRGPYALLRQGARAYVVRTGGRVRPMTHEEIAGVFRNTRQPQDAVSDVVREIEADLRKWADQRFAGMKVVVRPTSDLGLDLERTALEPLLRDAAKTGNRRNGWNFTSDHLRLSPFRPSRSGGGYKFGDESNQWSSTTILKRGDIELSIGLERLQWKGPPRTIWPFALIEFPVSIARMARTLYQAAPNPAERIVLGMGLFEINGWTLAPGSPESWPLGTTRARSFDDEDHFLGTPIPVGWDELFEAPDRLGYLLVRQVYEAFGYEEGHIPREYNRETRQLTFVK